MKTNFIFKIKYTNILDYKLLLNIEPINILFISCNKQLYNEHEKISSNSFFVIFFLCKFTHVCNA